MISFKRASELELSPKEWLNKNTIPTDGISILYGIDGNKNTQVALELALSLANGKVCHGRETPSARQVLYITVDSQNKVARRIKTWKTANQVYDRSLLSIMSYPIDLLDKNQLRQLVKDISYFNKYHGNDEYPALIVIDIQGGLTDEFSPNQLIRYIDYLRSEMGSAFLLVFNEGSCDGSNTFTNIFNAADAVHRVTATDNDLGVRLSCTKMKNFAKPSFVEFDISCVESISLQGGW